MADEKQRPVERATVGGRDLAALNEECREAMACLHAAKACQWCGGTIATATRRAGSDGELRFVALCAACSRAHTPGEAREMRELRRRLDALADECRRDGDAVLEHDADWD